MLKISLLQDPPGKSFHLSTSSHFLKCSYLQGGYSHSLRHDKGLFGRWEYLFICVRSMALQAAVLLEGKPGLSFEPCAWLLFMLMEALLFQWGDSLCFETICD